MLNEGQHEARVEARTDGGREDRTHRRLQDLYEISKIFASCEALEQPFDPALTIVSRTLPLRSAILIETDAGRSEMVLWKSEGQSARQTAAAKRHAQEAYRYLIGMPAAAALELTQHEGNTLLPRPVDSDGEKDDRFIVIPLVVAQRPPFGALQFEGVQPLDKTDLVFVNAIANQLAIALDRERAWQRDIARRTHAEERRTHAEEGRTAAEERRTHAEEGRTAAEAKGATAMRDRIEAESASDRYEALAAENARLYQEARQAVRAREQILAVVSHDLKNPLGAILMTADALAKRGIPDERRRGLPQAVGRIHRAAERMLRLIEDLLDFASIEAGRLAIKRGPQDPGRMIQETLASFEGVAEAKGLFLTADIEPHLPQVYCDRDRILQVFSNLVGNATKATAEGG